jgi:peptidoglycan hydrolase CwlO-like protein
MEELKQKLESLEARATRLEQEIDVETDEAKELAKRAELTSLNNRIAALQNDITEQRKIQGNFLFSS